MAITLQEIKSGLEKQYGRSAWRRGVIGYAWELFDNIEMSCNYMGLNYDKVLSINELKRAMLNGAQDWKEYSCGGCSYIYDADIAQALCTPSELKKTNGGRRRPNNHEEWLDVQARALWQAAELILSITRGC